jgi:hypothetical protein
LIFVLILFGIGLSIAGALLMRSRDRLGRIVLVAGATIVMAGMVWQTFAALL